VQLLIGQCCYIISRLRNAVPKGQSYQAATLLSKNVLNLKETRNAEYMFFIPKALQMFNFGPFFLTILSSSRTNFLDCILP